jgi:hypothetical protein
MAITGGAALVAGVAGTVGGISTTAIMVAGLAITAVGIITKNPLLMKIGGGMSLGSGVAGAANGAGAAAEGAAASAAPDATSAAITAPSVAETAGAGSQAAGDVAASNLGDVGVSAVTGSGAPMGFDTAASLSNAAPAVTDATGGLAATPVDSSLAQAANPNAGNSINANLAATDTSPAAQSAATPNMNPANVNPANTNAANVNAPNTNQANLAANSPVAPGSQAPVGVPGQSGASDVAAANTGVTGSGAPMGYNTPSNLSAGMLNGSAEMTPPSNYMGGVLDAIGKWWTGAGDKTQSAVIQGGLGVVSGVGKGALDMISAQQQTALKQQLQTFQMNNMSGASSVPKVGVTPSNGANPYANANTPTPAFAGTTPRAGLINTAQVQ